VYNFEKYRTQTSGFLVLWSWLQFIVTLLLLLFMLHDFTEIGFPDLFIYGGFIFAGIYGYTSLMDRSSSAPWIEVALGISGVAWILRTGTWFGLDALLPMGEVLVALYFIATALGGALLGPKAPSRTPLASKN
jgi:hypothetical protein